MIPRTSDLPGRRRLTASLGSLAVLGVVASCVAAPPARAATSNLTPLLTCIDVASGSITAHFGYRNVATKAITVPAGRNSANSQNWFLPNPRNRGQVSTFSVGTFNNVFTVTFSSATLEWRLSDVNGTYNSVVATASSSRCTPVPAAGVDSPWPVAAFAVGIGVLLAAQRRRGSAVVRSSR